VCQRCGIVVRDKKEVIQNGRLFCRPCAFGTYYRPLAGQVTECGHAEN
jgi:formylmethanofuran dehydrogenase subunit E